MSAEVTVIAPELGSGGVGDYTLRVVEQWGAVRPRFLVANLPRQPVDYPIEQLGSPLPSDGRILLQYSAYGFHRYGYPRKLLRALVDWKRETQGLLVVMFHEIWTFWPLLNKNRPVQWLHRRDIGALARAADAVFTSTRSQAEHLRRLAGSPRRDVLPHVWSRADRSSSTGHAEACPSGERPHAVRVLPVGSNIRPVAAPPLHRQPGRAVLFGLQASRIATLRRMHRHLQSLAAQSVITNVVTVGGGSSSSGNVEEKELISGLQLQAGAEFRGALPEDQVSELLFASSFAISAQDELSVTKSGTFIAYAAHGLNIISPYAAAIAPEPLCWVTHPTELLGGIADAELRARAERLRAWHAQTCSWPRIAEQFARALRLDVPQSMTEPVAAP